MLKFAQWDFPFFGRPFLFYMMKFIPTVTLLVISNVFMTFAWYWHLKIKELPTFAIILISWGIAFFEYCLLVPANRIGYQHFNAAELKTMQEAITFCVFMAFSVLYLKEELRWNYFVGFAFIVVGVFFVFLKK